MNSKSFEWSFDEAEATCVGCGCGDDNACMTERGPCHWLAVDRRDATGVCSQCPTHLHGWLARHPDQLPGDIQAAVDLADDTVSLVGDGFAYHRAFSPFGPEHCRTILDAPGFAGEARDALLERCNRVAHLLRELLPDSPAGAVASRPQAVCPKCGTQGQIVLWGQGKARRWQCGHCAHQEAEHQPTAPEDNPS